MLRALGQRSSSPLTVWWEAGPRDAILAEATRALPRETGGVLLGWSTATDVVISHQVGPGANAEHFRTRFLPDRDWQAEEIARIYERSGRTIAYLGDWHTHPGGEPFPSAMDMIALHRIAQDQEARCPRPVMGILGSDANEYWTAAFHVYNVRRTFGYARPTAELARLRQA